ncbi:peptidoglycan-binding protein [Gracilibacillus caseinilyticus]|uniref:Peptidoglycan-binding protein n=1 Tax=Gracilibacillus caseinilyticus TaxID=2932256 RepID=A0ABY4ES51_9BACI|nr:peptidoglycan-binding domain-containing protein [Gracilibacillus caseinilyticus]UOQ47256.1 peptidoglycan-binding protein [Gracilibacillus caseinilyticus]
MMLQRGSYGIEVKNLQNEIMKLGFGEFLDKWGAYSDFGEATERAVEAVQTFLGIKVDGIAGPQTDNASILLMVGFL